MRTKRWVFAINGIIALLFLGLIYAWSVFVGPLEAEFGWLRSETSLTFSISMASFCIGGLVGGFMSKKVSSRIVMVVGACFIVLGFSLSSVITSLTGLYVSYGVCCGFGVGMGYNATLNGVLRWFPDKQGLLSGVLLMGFGFGGSLLSTIAVSLMESLGWRMTFRILGVALGVLIVVSSFLLRKPTEADLAEIGGPAKVRGVASEDVPTGKMIKQRSFVGYFFWSALLSSVGLALIGNAASFAGGFTQNLATATFVAGLVNMFNGFGRLAFGFLFDIIGSKKCLYLITGGLVVSMLVLMGAIATGSIVVLAIGFVLTGLSFGGITPCNSAFIGKVYGQKYYSLNFSVVNLTLLISAFLGPYSAGIMQTQFGGYFSTIVLMLVFCAAGAPLLLLINKHAPGRQTDKKKTSDAAVLADS